MDVLRPELFAFFINCAISNIQRRGQDWTWCSEVTDDSNMKFIQYMDEHIATPKLDSFLFVRSSTSHATGNSEQRMSWRQIILSLVLSALWVCHYGWDARKFQKINMDIIDTAYNRTSTPVNSWGHIWFVSVCGTWHRQDKMRPKHV